MDGRNPNNGLETCASFISLIGMKISEFYLRGGLASYTSLTFVRYRKQLEMCYEFSLGTTPSFIISFSFVWKWGMYLLYCGPYIILYCLYVIKPV
ncbi:hypothetical protein OXIME_000755 [Oxyplasma meridianum]|uniref:Uncharacterized protein n=1 Tax=Oxyplasma meridianum TaxID=3073602 RepID=A0AAX4NGB0_9ARCH